MKNSEQWRGYDMAQLEQRRLINRIKSELVTSQLRSQAAGMCASQQLPGGKAWDTVQKAIAWSTAAVSLYRQVRGITDAFKSH